MRVRGEQEKPVEPLPLDAVTLPDARRGSHPAAAFDVTRRERQVLQLLCERMTDVEIGVRLFISTKTASNHVANILAKLNARNRREAAALAARHGLL